MGSCKKDWKHSSARSIDVNPPPSSHFHSLCFPASLHFSGPPSRGTCLFLRDHFILTFPLFSITHSHICFSLLSQSYTCRESMACMAPTHTQYTRHWGGTAPLHKHFHCEDKNSDVSAIGPRLRCHGYKDVFGRQRVFPERTPEVPENMPHP